MAETPPSDQSIPSAGKTESSSEKAVPVAATDVARPLSERYNPRALWFWAQRRNITWENRFGNQSPIPLADLRSDFGQLVGAKDVLANRPFARLGELPAPEFF